MSWIRWWGVGLFAAIVGVTYAVLMIFLDPFVETTIESSATEMHGAKVELGSAKTQLLAGELNLNFLAAANPDEPMSNILSAHSLAFGLDLAELIDRRVHISQMKLTGLDFNTKREESGAISHEQDISDDEESRDNKMFDLPVLGVPTVDDVLQKDKLQTLKQVDKVKASISAQQASIENKINGLPNKKKLQEYRARIDKLLKKQKDPLAYLTKAKEFKALKKDIDKELKAVKALKSDIKNGVNEAKNDIAALKDMPAKDTEMLIDAYSLGGEGTLNLSEKIFGEKLTYWLQQALHWYTKLSPYLQSSEEKPQASSSEPQVQKALGKGHYVNFVQEKRKPRFWLKELNIERLDNAKEQGFSGSGKHLTDAPSLTNKPMSLKLKAQHVDDMKDVNLSLLVEPLGEKMLSTVQFSVGKYTLKDLTISKSSQMPISMEQGHLNIQSDFKLVTTSLKGQVILAFDSVNFDVSPKGDSEIEKALSGALQKVKAFTIKLLVSGSVEKPEFKFSSNLDKQLSGAITTMAKEKVAGLKSSLQKNISAKLESKLPELQSKLSQYDQYTHQLDGLDQQLKDLLKKIKL